MRCTSIIEGGLEVTSEPKGFSRFLVFVALLAGTSPSKMLVNESALAV
jgi:hypothetical protein